MLDPFVGSGTTTKVALDLGRNAIRVELNPSIGDYEKKGYLVVQLGIASDKSRLLRTVTFRLSLPLDCNLRFGPL